MTYLKDDNGNDSIMRVMFVYMILYSTFMTTLVWFQTKNTGETIALFSALSGVATVLKLGQKQIEKGSPV